MCAAKKVYNTSLANVDWLHGSAELMLTLTNLFIVLGLRDAIRKAEAEGKAKAAAEAAAAATAAATSPGGSSSEAQQKQPAAAQE